MSALSYYRIGFNRAPSGTEAIFPEEQEVPEVRGVRGIPDESGASAAERRADNGVATRQERSASC